MPISDTFIRRAAYCYSERTNVGLFAAAAWRCDQIAIEEFATRKGNGWRGPGRVDLFVQIGRCALALAGSEPELDSEFVFKTANKRQAARRIFIKAAFGTLGWGIWLFRME